MVEEPRTTTAEFVALMRQLADGWSRQDVETALACFTADAVYMQPPDVQLYEGHDQLRPYFAALKPGTAMTFHHLWFDEASQVGAGEFTFGLAGAARADHGVAVVELRGGRIAVWREYLSAGPGSFAEFVARVGKTWQWHIGNYP